MLEGGCWIFLSHSSHDIEKVRRIRNEFERCGHNPLAFHLRCLSDDTPEGKEELLSLIHREIDSREWFVFCESQDALKSEYVQNERAYIFHSGKEMVWSLDMTKDIDKILEEVHKICLNIEVFVSYSHKDTAIADILIKELEKKDFSVWTGREMKPGGIWVNQIRNAIERSAKHGFYVILITENSLNSVSVKQELSYAEYLNAQIFPIVVGNHNPELSRLFSLERQCCYVEPTKEGIASAVNEIYSILKNQIKNKQ